MKEKDIKQGGQILHSLLGIVPAWALAMQA
jgi:hypothetical protein